LKKLLKTYANSSKRCLGRNPAGGAHLAVGATSEAKLRGRVGGMLLNAGGSNGQMCSSGGVSAQAPFAAICIGFKQFLQYLLLYEWVLSKFFNLCCYMHGF
jgi:hypothetical protein